MTPSFPQSSREQHRDRALISESGRHARLVSIRQHTVTVPIPRRGPAEAASDRSIHWVVRRRPTAKTRFSARSRLRSPSSRPAGPPALSTRSSPRGLRCGPASAVADLDPVDVAGEVAADLDLVAANLAADREGIAVVDRAGGPVLDGHASPVDELLDLG